MHGQQRERPLNAVVKMGLRKGGTKITSSACVSQVGTGKGGFSISAAVNWCQKCRVWLWSSTGEAAGSSRKPWPGTCWKGMSKNILENNDQGHPHWKQWPRSSWVGTVCPYPQAGSEPRPRAPGLLLALLRVSLQFWGCLWQGWAPLGRGQCWPCSRQCLCCHGNQGCKTAT